MATIGAMLKGSELLYHTTGKGISVGGLSFNSDLSSRLANDKDSATKLTGVNLASFGTTFDIVDSLVGKKHTLNGLIAEYNEDKNKFQNDLKREMKNAAKVSTALKKIDYKGTAESADKMTDKAKSAAKNLTDFLKKNDDDADQDALGSAINKLAAGEDADEDTVKELTDAVQDKVGMTQDEANGAKDAAAAAISAVNRFTCTGQSVAKAMQTGLDSIGGYLNYFERTGKFGADSHRLNKTLETVRNEFNRVGDLQNAASVIDDFAAAYKADEETKQFVAASAAAVSDYAAIFGETDAVAQGQIVNSIDAVRSFVRAGDRASDETTVAARDALSVLKNFAAAYGSAVNIDGENVQSLTNAADNLMAETVKANAPFDDLSTLTNYAKDFIANKNAMHNDARNVAEQIGSIIDNYNDTVNYLQKNTGLSVRFDSFVQSGIDQTDYRHALNNVGIVPQNDGTLSVDKEALSLSLADNSAAVENALGRNGLAGRIDNMVNVSSYRADNMFPSFSAFTGRNSFSSFYAADSLPVISYYGNIGNFMDMFI